MSVIVRTSAVLEISDFNSSNVFFELRLLTSFNLSETLAKVEGKLELKKKLVLNEQSSVKYTTTAADKYQNSTPNV